MADLRGADWSAIWEHTSTLPGWAIDASVADQPDGRPPRLVEVSLPTDAQEATAVAAVCKDNYSAYAAWRDDKAAYAAELGAGLTPAATAWPAIRPGAPVWARMCFAAATEVVRVIGPAAGRPLNSEWIAQATFACAAVESRFAPVGYRAVSGLAGAGRVRDLGMLQITPARFAAAKARKLTGPLLAGITHATLGIPFVSAYVGAVEWAAWFAGAAGRRTVEGIGAYWAGWAGAEFPRDLMQGATVGRTCPALRIRDFDRLPRLRKTVAILFPDSHAKCRPAVPVPSIWRWVNPAAAVELTSIPFIALAYRELALTARS